MVNIRKEDREKTTAINVRVSRDWLSAIDEWRANRPGLSPSRSDSIRELVLWALDRYPKTRPLKRSEAER
jgi:hypothetical protein